MPVKNAITQKQLEKLSGVRQPVIARPEKGSTDPKLSTVLKVLAPLGKTLEIVPIDKQHEKMAFQGPFIFINS